MLDPTSSVEHVIVLMMENRSFDHLFGFLDRPGLEPLAVGSHPNPLTLDDDASESFPVNDAGDPSLPVDPPHSYKSVVTQLHQDDNGENDGFVAAYFQKASGREEIAEVRWVRIWGLLILLAGALSWAAYALGDRWRTTGLLILTLMGLIFFPLWGVRGIVPAWWKMAAGAMAGAVAVGLLARAMRHEWWAAGLVFLVLAGAITAGLALASRRPRYVYPRDVEQARKSAPLVMDCVRPRRIPALAELARSFAICTRWYSSVPGATWPNRNFAHAGTSAGAVDIEFGFYRDRTIFEALSAAGKSWHIYHDGLAQVMAFPKLWRRKERLRNWFPLSEFSEHVANGTLPSYSFIEPSHAGTGSNSQHPGNSIVPAVDGIFDFQRADALIAAVYEALRNAPQGLERWMLLITYDEHGGLFDRCPPAAATPPGESGVSCSRWFVSKFVTWGSEGFDFASLGVRVPAVVVGPRVPSKVDDTIYDHASIVATLQDLFTPGADKLTERVHDANTFHGLASLSEPRTLPNLERYVNPEPIQPGLALRDAVSAAASPQNPIAGGLSSQLARLDRGVQWRGVSAHPLSWGVPSLATALRLPRPSRRRRLEPEAAPSAIRDPHANTVVRFQRQASRARRETAVP